MSKFKNLKEGQVLSETQFYVVTKIKDNQTQLKNLRGENIVVDDKYVNACLNSAHDYDKVEKLTRTDLAKKFIDSANIAMSVTFQKKVDPKDVIAELEAIYPNKGGKILPEVDYKKKVKAAVKDALEGQTRVLKGFHSGEQDEFGRIQAIDLEIVTGHNKRLVDARTISELIVGGVKYELK